ncbi:Ger(x)C family spore germination C-terminal domain-containing protein [Paenibacillus sp. LHD-117]|uniref:Ger(x)C family spore germination C-terminal domain-containing protein n=1 Tax=Paenibacillus sp. LHD-117 TaxID=3071412 RepID=UPI0027DF4D4A|nr:Ger(x)C family spore germination C-terminal domain-containing protein [Paenibacillus sp. LHD-117]MDQ6420039.1 Ger(x)C family spore germination C-terminal domain-containing protein [Paenibacillus sp. LHD-117]
MLTVGKTPSGSPIAFDIMQMIQGAQFATITPEQTLYTLWTELLDPGSDVVIPIINKKSNGRILIDSVALMDGVKFSGVELQQVDSKLLLLMMGKMNKTTVLDIPLQHTTHSLAFEVIKAANKMEIRIDEATGEIDCNIQIKLKGDISRVTRSLATWKPAWSSFAPNYRTPCRSKQRRSRAK